MFTNPELQVIIKTLSQRREWLIKNVDAPELAHAKAQNIQTIDVIDGILNKLNPQQTKNSVSVETPSSQTKPSKQPLAQRRAQMEPSKIRVLVVDDDELIASMIKAILQLVGIQHVHIANDGLKGISMLYDANPVYDLVLCDWNMPIKNGLDVHNAMRAAERYMEACFMLVTAVTEAKQIRSAIEEGVDDYVVKPIEEEKFIRKIARHFPLINISDAIEKLAMEDNRAKEAQVEENSAEETPKEPPAQ